MSKYLLLGIGAILIPATTFAYDFSAYVATSTNLSVSVATALFDGFLNLLGQLLPYGIGILIFYIGWNLARRALSGR